jgi:7-cyano-7-deazaguanine synthase
VSNVAVLFSGGLDSAVLLAYEARRATVHPLYVSAGLAWEADERRVAAALLESPPLEGRVRPLVQLEFTVRDLYPATHWAIAGEPPAYDTPDEDVYLAGRNLVLITKGSIYCARHNVPRLVLGPLAGNPFPDARPEFLLAMATAASLGLDHALEVEAPFSRLHKEDVIRLGVELGVPLERTMSCMKPTDDVHCGACSKCRERQEAFRDAGVPDPTAYRTWTGAVRGPGPTS